MATVVQANEVTRVVLFGGSSVATTYLPEEMKHHNVLRKKLEALYPKQKIETYNWADNGESIARYFVREFYEKQYQQFLNQQKGIDIAIIRFGTNDQKLMETDEYSRQMILFIDQLKEDFPGIAIVLETGIYVDYPRHYTFDRNEVLEPYWEVSRAIAKKFGYPLAEYYGVGKRAVEAGNWDIRIRSQSMIKDKRFILDDSLDAGRENDPKWFTDIHPNPVGVKMAVDEEARVLKIAFPDALPAGQKVHERKKRSTEDYSKYLNFDPKRLERKKSNPEKHLQEATKK